MFRFIRQIHLLVILVIGVFACMPQEEIITTDNGAQLSFSDNAVVFDTIFTSIGSITKLLKVYNPNKRAVVIQDISLGGQQNSPYDVLVNGRPLADARSARLIGGDSLLILVKVNINPRNESLPFIVYDSLLFHTNGNLQNVKLLAWGQDANFIRYSDASSTCDQVWTDGKPFVIYDSVVVAPSCKLTLEAGTQVYSFTNASIIIKGSLEVQGTPEKPVLFTSFRKEEYYQQPGQWGGIVFTQTSSGNKITGAEIRNATTGIRITSKDVNVLPKLSVENTVIKNTFQAGIAAVHADITVVNSVIANSVGSLFTGEGGGNYSFNHCTLASYISATPAILMNPVYKNKDIELSGKLSWQMQNSVVWGNSPKEIMLNNHENADLTTHINYNFMRTDLGPVLNGSNNTVNVDPKFTKHEIYNFKPDTLSPLINAGIPSNVTKDITGKLRDSQPDIGAYER